IMRIAAKAVTSAGRIIIGDVRDLRLLPHFKANLLSTRMPEKTSIKEFQWAVEQEVLREEELCVAPEYFYQLMKTEPRITHVEIRWKNGAAENELTKYRYTAIIHLGVNRPKLNPKWEIVDSDSMLDAIIARMKNGDPLIAVK